MKLTTLGRSTACLVVLLVAACSKQGAKYVIGGVVVDATNLERDKIVYAEASERWHRSKRSKDDPVTVAAAEAVKEISKKNYRTPLVLLGNHYAAMALEYPLGSAERNVILNQSRAALLDAAMLGDNYSMLSVSASFGGWGFVNKFESAVWACVAVEFGSAKGGFLHVEMASDAFAKLNPDEKNFAQRRADALIVEIRKNKAAYDELVGSDF